MKLSILFFLTFLFLSSCRFPKTLYCGANKTNPVIVYKKPKKLYKDFTKQFDSGIKGAVKAVDKLGGSLDISNVDATLKTKVIKLKDDMNNSSIRLNNILFRAAEAYNSRPCDGNVRDRYFSVLDSANVFAVKITEIENQAKEITKSSNFGASEKVNVIGLLETYEKSKKVINNIDDGVD